MNCDEARELITALVDNELSPLERSLIEGHLKECSRCVRAYKQEQSLKQEIHRITASMSAPAELKKRILTAHGMQPKEGTLSTGWKEILSFRLFSSHLALAFALVLLMLLPTIYFLTLRHSQPIAVAALQTQQKIVEGELSLRKATNQAEIRDWQIRAVNGNFAPMKYDLSSIRLEPAGGLVQDINGRRVLITVYSGAGPLVTCFTFLGTEEDAPKDAKVFFDQSRNVNFYTFSGSGYNAVLHREGEVICILMSHMLAEKLLALARGKAV